MKRTALAALACYGTAHTLYFTYVYALRNVCRKPTNTACISPKANAVCLSSNWICAVGCSRFTLAERKRAYEKRGESLRLYDTQAMLPVWKMKKSERRSLARLSKRLRAS